MKINDLRKMDYERTYANDPIYKVKMMIEDRNNPECIVFRLTSFSFASQRQSL